MRLLDHVSRPHDDGHTYPGHYEMQAELRRSGAARCFYLVDNLRVSFFECACPEYGVLRLAAFQREAP